MNTSFIINWLNYVSLYNRMKCVVSCATQCKASLASIFLFTYCGSMVAQVIEKLYYGIKQTYPRFLFTCRVFK